MFYNTSLKSCGDTGEVTLRLKHPTHSRKGAFLEHPKSLLQGDLSQLLGVLFLHCQISRMGNGVAQRGMHILLYTSSLTTSATGSRLAEGGVGDPFLAHLPSKVMRNKLENVQILMLWVISWLGSAPSSNPT